MPKENKSDAVPNNDQTKTTLLPSADSKETELVVGIVAEAAKNSFSSPLTSISIGVASYIGSRVLNARKQEEKDYIKSKLPNDFDLERLNNDIISVSGEEFKKIWAGYNNFYRSWGDYLYLSKRSDSTGELVKHCQNGDKIISNEQRAQEIREYMLNKDNWTDHGFCRYLWDQYLDENGKLYPKEEVPTNHQKLEMK